jgi:hypothetical protein
LHQRDRITVEIAENFGRPGHVHGLPIAAFALPVRSVERQAVGNFPLGGLSGERQFLQHGVSSGMTARTAPREILSLRVFRCRAVYFSTANLSTEL